LLVAAVYSILFNGHETKLCAGTRPAGPPILELSARDTTEDNPVPIQLSAHPHAQSSSLTSDLLIHVTQLPMNSSLNRGTYNGQIWRFTAADFGESELSFPEHASGTFMIEAEAIDPTASLRRTGTQQFTITPVADAPIMSVVHDPCICSGTFKFSIDSSLVDTDGSEVLEVIVSQLPDRTRLSAGQTFSNGNYIFNSTEQFMIENVVANFSQVDLTTLTMIVNARATETANGDSAVTSATVSVPVCPTSTMSGTCTLCILVCMWGS
jgi:hypothetical protein